jgi:branched-chain amino acid transport system substrate-binding protein
MQSINSKYRSVLLVGAALVAAAFTTSEWTYAADTVKIGAAFDVTGADAALDGSALNGAKLAVKELNSAGGLLGKQVELVSYDGKTDPTVISTIVSRLINDDKVPVIVGFTTSDAVLAAAPQFTKAGIPFVTPGATSPKLPSQAGKQLFMAAFGDNVQAAVGAQFAFKNLKAKTGYLITDDATEYTTLLSGYFKNAFEHGGGKLLGEDHYKSGDKNFQAQITRLKALSEKPDIIYISAMPDEIGLFVKQLRQNGVKQPILGGDGYDTPLLMQVGGNAANNVYYTTHSFVGPDAKGPIAEFSTKYATEYGAAPQDAFSALGYDSVRLVADAITRAKSDDPEAIRAALATTDGFKGATGVISFPNGSQIPQKSVAEIGVKDGALMLAAEEVPEYIPAP